MIATTNKGKTIMDKQVDKKSEHAFTPATVDRVWTKAIAEPGYDPAKLRKDICGMWIARDAYGTETNSGWEECAL